MTVVLLSIQKTYFGDIYTPRWYKPVNVQAYPSEHNVKALFWDYTEWNQLRALFGLHRSSVQSKNTFQQLNASTLGRALPINDKTSYKQYWLWTRSANQSCFELASAKLEGILLTQIVFSLQRPKWGETNVEPHAAFSSRTSCFL